MSPRRAALVLSACTIVQGSIAILVREVDLPAMAIVFVRVALGAATIAVLAAMLGRRDVLRFAGPVPLGLGVLVAAQFSLYFAAIQETSVASAVVITYAAPVFIAIFAPPLLGERLSATDVGALAISMGGVAVIALGGGSGEIRILGVVLAVFAALAFALLLVTFKRYAVDLHPITVVFWESLAAAALLAPVALTSSYAGVDLGGFAALVALGVVLTGVVTVLFVVALSSIRATTAGILTYFEPVSAALLAVALLGEPLTLAVVIGGAAIIGSGMMVLRSGGVAVANPATHEEGPPVVGEGFRG